MCENKYINIQTGEELDLKKLTTLPDNAMLKVKSELWIEWDFEKNNGLGLDIWKMTKGSDRKVWWICSKCNSDFDSVIHSRCRGTTCAYCKGLKVNDTNSLASLNPKLASEWHPTKNGKLTPHDVTKSSGKKVWWLGDCGHEWEALVSDRSANKGCKYCAPNSRSLKGFNDLCTTHPKIAERLLCKDDGYKYTYGSKCKVLFKCYCGNSIEEAINKVVSRGLKCVRCKDGISFGEKVIYTLLNKLNIKFQREFTPSWIENKRYDYYIESMSCIIEIMGIQHSKNVGGVFNKKSSLNEIQENDKYKMQQAVNNGIEHYIVIDAEKSTPSYLKNSIMNSPMSKLFDLNGISWDDIFLNASKSLLIDVCLHYKKEDVSLTRISEKFNLSMNTIIKYLKIGSELNLCEYEAYGETGILSIKQALSIPVVQLDMNGNFLNRYASSREASKNIGGNPRQISEVCKNPDTHKSAHGFMWMYEEDYNNGVRLTKYCRADAIQVVQLTLEGNYLNTYNSIYDASQKTDTSQSGIKHCCEGIYSKANNFIWVYKSEYETDTCTKFEVFNRERKIVQLDMDNNLIKIWNSIRDASNNLPCSYSSISSVLYGKAKSGHGFKWMYKEDYDACLNGEKEFPKIKKRNIVQLSLHYEFIKIFNTLTDVEKETNIRKSNVIRASKFGKTSGGYRWMYLEDYENKYGKIAE